MDESDRKEIDEMHSQIYVLALWLFSTRSSADVDQIGTDVAEMLFNDMKEYEKVETMPEDERYFDTFENYNDWYDTR